MRTRNQSGLILDEWNCYHFPDGLTVIVDFDGSRKEAVLHERFEIHRGSIDPCERDEKEIAHSRSNFCLRAESTFAPLQNIPSQDWNYKKIKIVERLSK
jgi:hypothetical protein